MSKVLINQLGLNEDQVQRIVYEWYRNGMEEIFINEDGEELDEHLETITDWEICKYDEDEKTRLNEAIEMCIEINNQLNK